MREMGTPRQMNSKRLLDRRVQGHGESQLFFIVFGFRDL
jgi:hypothetical protein